MEITVAAIPLRDARARLDIPRTATKCGVAGCLNSTREQKPYCPDHVLEHPYAHDLHKKVEDAECLVWEIIQTGRVPARFWESHLWSVMLEDIKDRPRTPERWARECLVDADVAKRVAAAALRRGLVAKRATKRAVMVVAR